MTPFALRRSIKAEAKPLPVNQEVIYYSLLRPETLILWDIRKR